MTEVEQSSRDINAYDLSRPITRGEKLKVMLMLGVLSAGVIYGSSLVIRANETNAKKQEERKKALEETATQNDGFFGSEYIHSNYINLNLGSCTLMGVEAEIEGKGSDINVNSYSAPINDRLTLSFRNMEELQKIVGANPCSALIEK